MDEVDQDTCPLVQSEQAHQEFKSASRAHEAAAADNLSGELDDPQSHSQSSGKRTASTEAAQASESVFVAPSASGGTRFQSSLGIQGLSKAQRKGITCYHCSGQIEKGSFKFGYAWKLNKPMRSIHLDCLAQTKHYAASISALEQLYRDFAPSSEEQQICRQAIETLTSFRVAVGQ